MKIFIGAFLKSIDSIPPPEEYHKRLKQLFGSSEYPKYNSTTVRDTGVSSLVGNNNIFVHSHWLLPDGSFVGPLPKGHVSSIVSTGLPAGQEPGKEISLEELDLDSTKDYEHIKHHTGMIRTFAVDPSGVGDQKGMVIGADISKEPTAEQRSALGKLFISHPDSHFVIQLDRFAKKI